MQKSSQKLVMTQFVLCNTTERRVLGDISFTQAQIKNIPLESKRGTNFLCFDIQSVEQKADLPLSDGVSKQLYLPPFDFLLFCKRESSRRGIGKLRKRFGN